MKTLQYSKTCHLPLRPHQVQQLPPILEGQRENGFYVGLIEVQDSEAFLRSVSGRMKPASPCISSSGAHSRGRTLTRPIQPSPTRADIGSMAGTGTSTRIALNGPSNPNQKGTDNG